MLVNSSTISCLKANEIILIILVIQRKSHEEFQIFLDVLVKVLLIFATISLVVASVMIVIITYVSVIEKTRQVGILRSLGMSQFNVMCLFINENIIIISNQCL